MTTSSKRGSTFADEREQNRERYSVLRVLPQRKEKSVPASNSSKESVAGADDDEDPPVPMPNTVVKLVCAEDTWMATSRENR